MRPLLAAVLVALAAAPAAAQPARSILLAVVVDGGGSTEYTEPRFAAQAGYVVEETAGSGLTIAARYVAAVHLLSSAIESGGSGGLGGDGWLLDTGVDVEAGWALGPVRPYYYTGYHYYRQRLSEALCRDWACGDGEGEPPPVRAQAFARSSGYGLVLAISGWGALYGERFDGGNRSGVMRTEGTRLGIRIGTGAFGEGR